MKNQIIVNNINLFFRFFLKKIFFLYQVANARILVTSCE